MGAVSRACIAIQLGWIALGVPAAADVNVPFPTEALERQLDTEPFRIVSAEISRPKAKGDITLKAEISFSGQPPYRVKLRRAEPGAEDFNNRPRYDLAAYELQKLFLDPDDYVVPPTALRMMPLGELRPYAAQAEPTFRGSDEVLVVLQYWLQEVKVVADVYDPARFAADPGYARHVGHLNVLTWLIEHGDANVGNFLLSRAEHSRGSSPWTTVSRSPTTRATAATPGSSCASNGCPRIRWSGCAASIATNCTTGWACWRSGASSKAAGSPPRPDEPRAARRRAPAG